MKNYIKSAIKGISSIIQSYKPKIQHQPEIDVSRLGIGATVNPVTIKHLDEAVDQTFKVHRSILDAKQNYKHNPVTGTNDPF